MKKHISLIFCILIFVQLVSTRLVAQHAYRDIIYKAYISGDMNKWAAVIYTIEKDAPTTLERKLELVNYYYGYIGYLLGAKKYDLAQKYINKDEQLINEIVKLWPQNATIYAYKGSCIGFKISISKFKAITLGPQSIEYVDKAVKLDPANVQGIVDRANALYHTPALFGGDKKESLKLFQKGVQLLESTHRTENNWFYLNVLTLIAKNQEQLGYLKQAKQTYEKIIQIEPDFKWVRNELYPDLLRKMK